MAIQEPPARWLLSVVLRNGCAFAIECDIKPHLLNPRDEFERIKGRRTDSVFRTADIVAWRIIEQHVAIGRIVDDPREDAN